MQGVDNLGFLMAHQVNRPVMETVISGGDYCVLSCGAGWLCDEERMLINPLY